MRRSALPRHALAEHFLLTPSTFRFVQLDSASSSIVQEPPVIPGVPMFIMAPGARQGRQPNARHEARLRSPHPTVRGGLFSILPTCLALSAPIQAADLVRPRQQEPGRWLPNKPSASVRRFHRGSACVSFFSASVAFFRFATFAMEAKSPSAPGNCSHSKTGFAQQDPERRANNPYLRKTTAQRIAADAHMRPAT